MALKDDDIKTRRVTARRSFLAKATGVLAGAFAVASGVSAEDKDKKKRDTQDFTPADNKSKPKHDSNTRSGDLVGK